MEGNVAILFSLSPRVIFTGGYCTVHHFRYIYQFQQIFVRGFVCFVSELFRKKADGRCYLKKFGMDRHRLYFFFLYYVPVPT